MEVMENVLDGEGYETWRRLHHACDPRLPGRCAIMLLDLVSHVFQDAELQNHLLRSAGTLDSFPSIKDDVINYSLAEAAARD